MGFLQGLSYVWIIEWVERGINNGTIFPDEAENIINWVRALDNKYMDYWGKKLNRPKSGSGTMI
jgi:hypothetical protein